MAVHPRLSLLPLGKKMQNLFRSKSSTPNLKKTPALLNPRAKVYNLPLSFHSFSHRPSFSSRIQWIKPSLKSPKMSSPNRTHVETPRFFSTTRTWHFPFLSSRASSKVLDSTVKLRFRLASPISSSSPSHALSRALSPSLSLALSRSLSRALSLSLSHSKMEYN